MNMPRSNIVKAQRPLARNKRPTSSPLQSSPHLACAMGRSAERGFSLLEVLIALLIAGLALATTFSAASESMRATKTAEQYQEAVSRARSHLDSLHAHLAAGEQAGDDGGGFHWRSLVRAVDSTAKREAGGKPVPEVATLVVTLYAATVWITWTDRTQPRSIRLDSARLLTTGPS